MTSAPSALAVTAPTRQRDKFQEGPPLSAGDGGHPSRDAGVALTSSRASFFLSLVCDPYACGSSTFRAVGASRRAVYARTKRRAHSLSTSSATAAARLIYTGTLEKCYLLLPHYGGGCRPRSYRMYQKSAIRVAKLPSRSSRHHREICFTSSCESR